MLREYQADLHIHTCLSPCGELEMHPAAIVKAAIEKKIPIIGICDHNSCENAVAVIEAADGKEVTVIPGIEVTSQEEVHICALFESVAEALKLQQLIYDNLDGENNPAVFGMQVVVEADGTVSGFNPRLLIGAAHLTLERVVKAIHALKGLAIAAHIDREGFGIIGQLGFIPPQLELDALEISYRMSWDEARIRFREYCNYPILRSSDAHCLDAIGRARTTFRLEGPSFAEICRALKGINERSVIRL